MNTTVPLGKELADRRRALGLTQGELAFQVGVGMVEVLRWERGKFKPSLPNYLRLQETLMRLDDGLR